MLATCNAEAIPTDPGRSLSVRRQTLLAGSALAALTLGIAVYLLDRDWHTVLFLAPLADFQPGRYDLFGSLGGVLPSFLHAYAISMLLAVALSPWPGSRLPACAAWFGVAGLLELLQAAASGPGGLLPHPGPAAGAALPEFIRGYAVSGRFDAADLWTTALGCAVTYSVVGILRTRP